MAEAILAALGVQEKRERPASAYYNAEYRAEGQPVFNTHEREEEAAASEENCQVNAVPAVLRQFVPVPLSRPHSPVVDFIRRIDALAAENAVQAYADNRVHISVINDMPNMQPHAAQVVQHAPVQQQEAMGFEAHPLPLGHMLNVDMFPQPPLPPPSIVLPPPKDASVTFYGLEHRADSFHKGRTGLEAGVSNVKGQLTLDIDCDLGTMRHYAVGVKDASMDFNISYFSNTNGNVIQRRPGAKQANKQDVVLLLYESTGQTKRRDATHWAIVTVNFFHVLTCGLVVLIFMLWCFPVTWAVQPNFVPDLSQKLELSLKPEFPKEEPVLFLHSATMYPSSHIVRAQMDIDVTGKPIKVFKSHRTLKYTNGRRFSIHIM